uniref:Uncharacterized protein n=1 Tax=Heterorhabditis bacteriophora TaxID=37862 RepID=A0A1I7XAJ4_HETBA
MHQYSVFQIVSYLNRLVSVKSTHGVIEVTESIKVFYRIGNDVRIWSEASEYPSARCSNGPNIGSLFK